MSTFTNPISVSAGYRPASETPDLLERLLTRAARRLDRAAEYRRLRRASALLAAVDDRTLRDIGLARCRLDQQPLEPTRFVIYD